MLEARLQNASYGRLDDWAVQCSLLQRTMYFLHPHRLYSLHYIGVLLCWKLQNASYGRLDDWAVQCSLLQRMMCFLHPHRLYSLHYKLHSDPWISKHSFPNKEFGLPQYCGENKNKYCKK
ncbi:hypothetical protein SUGI_1191210 [Cryptomeria japonica]|nr:hypothetical protein SUGI_1191210 [Cryptomeria japonica]